MLEGVREGGPRSSWQGLRKNCVPNQRELGRSTKKLGGFPKKLGMPSKGLTFEFPRLLGGPQNQLEGSRVNKV